MHKCPSICISDLKVSGSDRFSLHATSKVAPSVRCETCNRCEAASYQPQSSSGPVDGKTYTFLINQTRELQEKDTTTSLYYVSSRSQATQTAKNCFGIRFHCWFLCIRWFQIIICTKFLSSRFASGQ